MEKYKNLKAHTRYYVDGKRVPGTTTILGVMDKGYGLKKWYWPVSYTHLTLPTNREV